jgi:hypothetical protein
MKILAIDPGPEQSAFVTWNNGTLGYCNIQSNTFVRDSLQMCIYDLVAIEMIACYGMPVGKETFETCLWIGRFCERSPIEPRLIYRRDVKLHHCGSARAKDSNIRQALIDKYGAPGTKKAPGVTYGLKSHLWAAFAIATYVSETELTTANASAK